MRTPAFLAALLLFVLPAAGDEPGVEGTGWRQRHEPPDDAWKKANQELVFNNLSEPETIDPALMTGNPEHTLALALYEGLTSHDPETLEPRPGVAESWEVGENGTLYTLRLRKNAKWSNGDPVTAEDFLWSWYRAITNALCDYAYLFYYIEGAEDFHKEFAKAGAAPPYAAFRERVKASAPDPHTIVVKLRAPASYFLDLCTFETYMPVHRATVEKHGDQWTRPANWVGNGPLRLVEWNPRQHIVMEPNKRYWDAGSVKLTKVTALPIDDLDVAYNKFLKGEADWIRSVPTSKIDDAKRRPEYFVTPYLTTYFYRINTTKPHLNKTVRQALSLAINRETITRDVLRAGQIPATWLCPPMARYAPPKGLPSDPDRARALLKQAGYPGGEGFPKLTLFYNTHEDHKRVAEQIGQMWRETLGIQVSLQNAEWKVYLRQVELLDYDVARAGWIGDYADPMTFLDMWVTDGGNNNTGWSNPKYDELIRKAMYEGDPEKRAAILVEAEKIIVEDEFPILPIYIYVNQGMKVDRLRGWYENVRDLHPFQYMYFEED